MKMTFRKSSIQLISKKKSRSWWIRMYKMCISFPYHVHSSVSDTNTMNGVSLVQWNEIYWESLAVPTENRCLLTRSWGHFDGKTWLVFILCNYFTYHLNYSVCYNENEVSLDICVLHLTYRRLAMRSLIHTLTCRHTCNFIK